MEGRFFADVYFYSPDMHPIAFSRIIDSMKKGDLPMSKSLVLAEKPSVARDIARVLGCNKKGNGFLEGTKYIVTWALGHLVTHADPEGYGNEFKEWKLEHLADYS